MSMSSGEMRGIIGKVKPYVLMVCLQFGSAGNLIISMATLNHGMNRYVLIVYRNAIAALTLAPFALILERKVRPKMTLKIFLHIMALGFLEPILDQGFSYLGMQFTSATFTSAIINTVPSLTFIIAVIFRLEKIKIKQVRSQAKVMGTVVTLGGALLMSLYKGPIIHLPWSAHDPNPNHAHADSDHHASSHWLAGTLLLLLGCLAWSCFYVLQSITISKYPAEISLSALICLAGTLQSAAIAVVVERHSSGWAVGWDSRLFAPLYTGIVSSGITYYVQGIVMKTRGPVFVTAFNPLCMIIVAALASFLLSEQLHLGSVIGGVIIAMGLYCVVWGKGRDYSSSSPTITKTTTTAAATDHLQHELPITKTTTTTATPSTLIT